MEKLAQILIYLLILFVTNIFGLFNVLEEYRLPGIGKPSDFVLLALNLLVILKIFNQNYKIDLQKEINRLIKLNLLILAYIFFLVLYTVYIKNIETFNYSLRVASHFFYYSSFLFPIYLIDDHKNFYRLINFLRLGGWVTGLATIISNILGYNIASGVVSGEEGNFIRVYMPGFFNYFVVLLWFSSFLSKRKYRFKISYIEIIVNALGIFLFLGRTRILVLLLMIIFIFIFLTKRTGKRWRIIFAVSALSISIILFLQIFNFPINTFVERFLLGYEQLKDPNQALTGRWLAMTLGYDIFINSPIFGTGFVHPTSSYYQAYLTSFTGQALTNSADFGLVSILFTTGIVGMIVILNFIVKYLLFVYKYLKSMLYKNQINEQFIFSISIFAIILFVFFVEQIAGNEFASRIMAVDLVAAGYSIKFLRVYYEN